ncbi:unnamed protein product, partial [Nesidiocoris tenuis]
MECIHQEEKLSEGAGEQVEMGPAPAVCSRLLSFGVRLTAPIVTRPEQHDSDSRQIRSSDVVSMHELLDLETDVLVNLVMSHSQIRNIRFPFNLVKIHQLKRSVPILEQETCSAEREGGNPCRAQVVQPSLRQSYQSHKVTHLSTRTLSNLPPLHFGSSILGRSLPSPHHVAPSLINQISIIPRSGLPEQGIGPPGKKGKVRGRAAKNRTKIKFDGDADVVLLKEVAGKTPFEDGGKWKLIAEKMKRIIPKANMQRMRQEKLNGSLLQSACPELQLLHLPKSLGGCRSTDGPKKPKVMGETGTTKGRSIKPEEVEGKITKRDNNSPVPVSNKSTELEPSDHGIVSDSPNACTKIFELPPTIAKNPTRQTDKILTRVINGGARTRTPSKSAILHDKQWSCT